MRRMGRRARRDDRGDPPRGEEGEGLVASRARRGRRARRRVPGGALPRRADAELAALAVDDVLAGRVRARRRRSARCAAPAPPRRRRSPPSCSRRVSASRRCRSSRACAAARRRGGPSSTPRGLRRATSTTSSARSCGSALSGRAGRRLRLLLRRDERVLGLTHALRRHDLRLRVRAVRVLGIGLRLAAHGPSVLLPLLADRHDRSSRAVHPRALRGRRERPVRGVGVGPSTAEASQGAAAAASPPAGVAARGSPRAPPTGSGTPGKGPRTSGRRPSSSPPADRGCTVEAAHDGAGTH